MTGQRIRGVVGVVVMLLAAYSALSAQPAKAPLAAPAAPQAAAPPAVAPAVAPATVAPTLPPLVDQVRIMDAGDSISAGVPVGCPDSTWYGGRAVLGDWLTRVAGLDVVFVGGINASCAGRWGRSEGHPGETIRGLADRIAGYLTATPADVLILRVGVNDTTSWSGHRSAAQMAVDYTRLLDNARAARPGIRILAGEIIPPDGAVNNDLARASVTAREFNELLPTIVAPYGDSVHIAEYGRITPWRLEADGLHPSPKGHVDISYITMQQPDGLWPWLSLRPPPAVRPWDTVYDLWR